MSDYISKAEAIEWLKEAKDAGCIDGYSNAIRRDHFDEAIETIESIPTVDAEPVRHGKWRDYQMHQLGFPAHIYMMRQCSVCEHAVENRTPYCPWCGAKMDGEREEE